MATRSLEQRFTHGNFGDLPMFSAEADFFAGGPARQRELVTLAKAQVAIAEETCSAIREGADQISTMVRRELEQQTAALSSVISEGADRMVSAVDNLADRVTAELVEVRWELLQIRNTNEQILEVLRRPRSTEAQELLQQGIRNLVNDKLEQAEERFLRALDLDNTDYQVLMNLSAVALRKGNAHQVLTYLQDALTLPPKLDSRARAEALWLVSRFYYTQSDYGSAARIAKESLALFSTPRRVLQLGIYQILSSNGRDGFSTIETAIRSDPRLFGFAATFPDLVPHKGTIAELHSSLARQIVSRVRAERDYLIPQVPLLKALPMIVSTILEADFSKQIGALGTLLERGSYSELCAALPHAETLRSVLPAFERLSVAERELSLATAQHDRAVIEVSNAEAVLKRCPDKQSERFSYVAALGCGGAFLGALSGAVLIGIFFREAQDTDGVKILFFTMVVGLPLFLIIRGIIGQDRRDSCEQTLKDAQKGAEEAKLLLDSAKLSRSSAFRVAAIPAWPLAVR